MSNFLGGSLPSNVGSLGNSVFQGGSGNLGYSGSKFNTSAFNNDFFTNKGRQGISNRDAFGGGFNFGNAFSGQQALEGFKSLLDVSKTQGDKKTEGSYGQGYGFQGYGGSRGGQGGGFVGGTPGYSSSIYLPDGNSGYIGGGGQAGGGGKQRFAKVASGGNGCCSCFSSLLKTIMIYSLSCFYFIPHIPAACATTKTFFP